MSKFDRDFDSRYTVFDDYGISQAETIRLSFQGPSVIEGVSGSAIANVNKHRTAIVNNHLAAIYGGVLPAGWTYANTANTPGITAVTSPGDKGDAMDGATEISIPAIDELKKQVASLEQKNSALVIALNKVMARVERLETQLSDRNQKQSAPGGYWEET